MRQTPENFRLHPEIIPDVLDRDNHLQFLGQRNQFFHGLSVDKSGDLFWAAMYASNLELSPRHHARAVQRLLVKFNIEIRRLRHDEPFPADPAGDEQDVIPRHTSATARIAWRVSSIVALRLPASSLFEHGLHRA